jgi:hypothetical protein
MCDSAHRFSIIEAESGRPLEADGRPLRFESYDSAWNYFREEMGSAVSRPDDPIPSGIGRGWFIARVSEKDVQDRALDLLDELAGVFRSIRARATDH